MRTHSNYSDDIRMYDSDPRSPFYSEPDCCEICDSIIEGDIDPDGVTWYCSNQDCPSHEEE
jgi:hypothetical protein